MDNHHQTPTGGVLVPLLQSVISGLLAGALAVSLGFVLAWSQPWAIGALIGTGTAALTWFSLLGEWRRFLAGVLGIEAAYQESEPAERVRVVVTDEDYSRGTYADLPANITQLNRLGSGLVEGVPFAESHWIGRGRPFSRGQFRELRDELVKRGLLRWADPGYRQLGVELTPAGKAAARVFASLAAPPFPQLHPQAARRPENGARVRSE